MCRDIREELRQLDLDVAGQRMTDAQAQRLIHQTLFEAMQQGTRRQQWRALDAWTAHVQEHRQQAQARQAQRQRVK